MKVILVNGSPHKTGCTYTGLEEVAKELNYAGIETEIFHIGTDPIAGCCGCGRCSKTSRCFIDDKVNEFLAKAESADGFVFGAPVHFASVAGAVSAFMDRAFCSKGKLYWFKPAAAIVSCRRAGSTASLDQLYKYFQINSMPIVSSKYWNMIHGNTPEEVAKDLEGMQTLRELGRNMAWMLKCIAAGKSAGINPPEKEIPIKTNFIR